MDPDVAESEDESYVIGLPALDRVLRYGGRHCVRPGCQQPLVAASSCRWARKRTTQYTCRVLTYHAGMCAGSVQVLACDHCQWLYYPHWVEVLATTSSRAWYPLGAQVVSSAIFTTRTCAVDVVLLKYFDELFVHGAMPFTGFLHAYFHMWPLASPTTETFVNAMRDKVFEPAYVVWICWTMHEEASLPFGLGAPGLEQRTMAQWPNICLGKHAANKEKFIQAHLAALRCYYGYVWVCCHHLYCTDICAAAQAWDGNLKLYSTHCPAHTEPMNYIGGRIQIPQHCQEPVLKGKICCRCHQSLEENFQNKAKKAAVRGRPLSRRAPAETCQTLKEKHIRSTHRSCAVFCGRFIDCGTYGFANKFFVSESRPFVTAAIAQHAIAQPLFREFLYDDTCHIEEWWELHLAGSEHPLAPRLLALRGCLTRSHQRGHTRWQCHTDFAADVYPCFRMTWEYESTSMSEIELVLSTAPNTKRCPTSILQIAHADINGNTVTLRADPPAQLLWALRHERLPFEAAFAFTAGGRTGVSCCIRTEDRRGELLQLLSQNKITAKCHSNRSVGPVRLRKGMRLWQISRDGVIISQSYTHEALRARLRSGTPFPVRIWTKKNRNGEVCEQGWRRLNRFKETLRHCAPAMFDLLLLRVLHAENCRRWNGVPLAALEAWRDELRALLS